MLKVVMQNNEGFADVILFVPAYVTSTFHVMLGWYNRYAYLATS